MQPNPHTWPGTSTYTVISELPFDVGPATAIGRPHHAGALEIVPQGQAPRARARRRPARTIDGRTPEAVRS